MKVICNTAFEHSGVQSYLRDEIYVLTVKEAEGLAGIAGRKKDSALGSLGYFTPADDEARAFFAARVNKGESPAAAPAGKTKPPAAGSSGIF
ncbi:MAG: hypothetical protein LBL20_01305 [Treponema sp.]|jgi:hypothetical protein|nr:hypothetical protein [Treponema sp.]